ncbi:hypothetical protein GCM10007159_28110 [Modicisalibacter luteus]|nr:hypothetical protein GCM10007159_28110 [Halomonas lutea]
MHHVFGHYYFNGDLQTVERDKPRANAVAIKRGEFIAVGSDAEVMAFRNVATEVIDLQGDTVVPSLNDSHPHLIRGCLNYNLGRRIESAERHFQQPGVELVVKHHSMHVAGY